MTDFYDFKELSSCVKNFDVDENGNQIKWTEICRMEFSSGEPNVMRVWYSYAGEPKVVNLMKNIRKARRSTQSHSTLKQLYTSPLLLSSAKYED